MKAASPLSFKRKLHRKVVMEMMWKEDPDLVHQLERFQM